MNFVLRNDPGVHGQTERRLSVRSLAWRSHVPHNGPYASDARRVVIPEAARGGPENSNDYGYLWWLNTKGGTKSVPTTSFSAQGNGSNTIFIDPDDDLVIVWRWHAGGDFYARVVASIKGS